VDARAGGDPTAVAATDDDYDDNDDDDDDDDDEGGREGSDKTAPNGNRLVGGAELVLQTSTDRIWLGGDTDFFIFGGSIIEEEREIEVSSNSK
jgi:hypothetical protein